MPRIDNVAFVCDVNLFAPFLVKLFVNIAVCWVIGCF